jgi:hypothetical protein
MRRYLLWVLLIDVVGVGPAGYAVSIWLGAEAWTAIALAHLVTTLNAAAAAAVVRGTAQASMNTFTAAVLGGMMVRMLMMLLVLATVVAVTELPHFTFTISLFLAYICKSVMEMIFIRQLSENRPS